MISRILKYLRKNIFAYINIVKTFEITKISKKFINELETNKYDKFLKNILSK